MNNLQSIERELKSIITRDKKNWTHFYILLKEVEQNELWRDNFKSFTAWVKDFCIKTKTHESIIWARKKAGEVYQNYANVQKEKGIDVADITEIDVAQDTLVLLDKISRKAPQLGAELTEKALNKEIKKKDLQEAYKTIRSKSENSFIDNNISDLKIESEQIKEEIVTAGEIVTTLYSIEWLGANKEKKRKYFKTSFEQNKYRAFTEFPVFTGTSRKSRRMDILIAENVTSKNTWQLNLHGVEIKVSKSDLLNDTKYTEYAEFVDYLWLAVPVSLLDAARETKPRKCGIIVINNKRAEIAEQAERINGARKYETLMSLVLKIL